MTPAEKIRENRLRRAAERQGLTLRKSRARDPLSLFYGRWWASDADHRLQSPEQGLTTDEMERYLRGDR
jgi:hypothetical protein